MKEENDMRLFKRIISSLLKYKDVWTLKDLASKKDVYNMAYYKKTSKKLFLDIS